MPKKNKPVNLRTEGMKQARSSEARERFRDGVKVRATTIPSKRDKLRRRRSKHRPNFLSEC